MKTRNKALLLSLCAVLLVATSVLRTMAYLTDQQAVVNTFTVGSIVIDMDEADVKPDGTADETNEDKDILNERNRVTENTYHLLPGHEYIKDPIIYIDVDCEDAWVFVKVENGITAYEADQGTIMTDGNVYDKITKQITDNGWTALEGVPGVYYMAYAKDQQDKNLEVFAEFKIANDANIVNGWATITADTHKINVTGYAVQKDGFDTAGTDTVNALAAWKATFGANDQH